MSLKMWFKMVGSVNLTGSHPAWIVPAYLSKRSDEFEPWYTDPLVVTDELFDVAIDEWQYIKQNNRTGSVDPCCLWIAPDAAHKANISGGDAYKVSIEEPAIDTVLRGEPHNVNFVDYLRIAFKWGGFPGVEHIPEFPKSFLKDMRKDLLPI